MPNDAAELLPIPELNAPLPTGASVFPKDVRPVSVPEEDAHFAFRARDRGPCGRMTGDILVLMVFVNTPQHPWTNAKKSQVQTMADASIRFLRSQAMRYGVNLSMAPGYLETSVPMEYPDTSEYMEWYKYVMKNYFHSESMTELHQYYENKLHKSDTPVAFLFTNEARSCAVNASTDYASWMDEFCMIFCDSNMQQLELAHELCHQYGAVDLYDYKKEGIADETKKLYPRSVMLTVYGPDIEVDELTAYLLGWTDKLTPKAKRLLEAIRGKRK